MAQELIDISGERRGKLTVERFAYTKARPNGTTRSYWECKCDCGNTVTLRKDQFYYAYSHVKSCGCWKKEESSKRLKDKITGKFVKIEG